MFFYYPIYVCLIYVEYVNLDCYFELPQYVIASYCFKAF